MTTEELFAKIAAEIRFDEADGWRHERYGLFAETGECEHLIWLLYHHYYLGRALAPGWQTVRLYAQTAIKDKEDRELADALDAARPDKSYESAGWRLLSNNDGEALVARSGVELCIRPEEWRHDPNKNGDAIVLMPTVRRYASNGYFAAFSRFGPAVTQQGINRLYVNIGVDDAPTAMRGFLALAGDLGLPMTVKVANAPLSYDRCDTLVVYLCRADFDAHSSALQEWMRPSGCRLRERVPAFTATLAPGFAWAEDPASDGLEQQSFGMHRCRVIGTALAGSERSGRQAPADLMDLMVEAWQAAGLDLAHPYLSPRR